MTIYNHRTLASAVLLAGVWLASAAQNEVVFTNVDADTQFTGWGTGRAETYEVAVHVTPDMLNGAKVAGFQFMMQTTAEMSGCSGWLSATLGMDGETIATDVKTDAVTLESDRISVTLPEEYTVSDEGVYIGIQFTMDSKESDAAKKPVSVINDNSLGLGMYAHTSRTYKKWTDIYDLMGTVPGVRIILSGQAAESASVTLPAELISVDGKAFPVRGTLLNSGSATIESIELQYSYGSQTKTAVCEFPGGAEVGYMMTMPIELTVPAFSGKGTDDLKVSVTKVNDKANAAAAEVSTSRLSLVSFRPTYRPLLEEYTGAKCGYCPRGEIGMKKMEELYGDRFIGVAYHVSDIMSILDEKDFANPAPAQPVAWLSRVIETDPYFGNLPFNSKTFGFDGVWEEEAAVFTEASLDVECQWTGAEKESINIDSRLTFIRDHDDADYRMVYLLVADGLKGQNGDPRWFQGNYYTGQTGQWPEEFDWLVESPQWIEDVEYDNVVIYTPNVLGEQGSVAASVKGDEEMSLNAEIKIADAVNLDGASLVQDKDRLRVVAVLVDGSDGHVVNAAVATPWYDSIEGIDADGPAVSVRYYDTCGRAVTAGSKGILIKVSSYADGTVKAEKILAK